MDLHSIFKRTSSEWVHFSKYEYREIGGREYLTPAADSDISIYNPLDVAEDLVVDALNLGALLCQSEELTEKGKAALLDFTRKYGLLGFMTAIPLNSNFPNVFVGRNGFFDVDFMETKDYLQIFQPFGIKQEQPRTGFTLPPALLMGETLEYEIVFSRNYSERTDWLFGVFSEVYTHFAACAAYHATDNPVLQGRCADIVSSFCEYGLGFRMRMDGKPTMMWDFNSLKTALETVYAFLVSSAGQPLRICKHCSKVFYATHGRTEFCSGRCRNQFNVYKSRGKKGQ